MVAGTLLRGKAGFFIGEESALSRIRGAHVGESWMNIPDMNATPNDPRRTIAKITVGSILTTVAGRVTSSMDAFAGWMLAGLGAGLAFILGNISSVAAFISISCVQRAVLLFIAAAIMGILSRYIAVLVTSSSEAGAKGEERGEKLGPLLDTAIFAEEFERAAPWGGRWLVRRSITKVLQGDFAYGGRFLMAMATVHSTLVFIELCLVLSAIAAIFFGLRT